MVIKSCGRNGRRILALRDDGRIAALLQKNLAGKPFTNATALTLIILGSSERWIEKQAASRQRAFY
jgi:hypothetical protein